MLNKLYEKLKKFLKENGVGILILIAVYLVCNFELPYYIDAPGSLLDTQERVKVEAGDDDEGNFYMASVSEIKGILPTLLIAWLHPEMDIVKKEEKVYNNETYEEATTRSRLLLKSSQNNAIMAAFEYAGAHYELKELKLSVILIEEYADTDLKIGDQIYKVNDRVITDMQTLKDIIATKEVGDILSITVLEDEKEIMKKAKIQLVDGEKYIGIAALTDYEIVTSPKVEFSFKASESGSSGGLMLALAIYNSLVEEDITKGRKIVGTGTIEVDGTVGAIGGVKYKIAAAVKEGTKIFIVPQDNYEEAKQVVEENDYDIDLLVTSTFEETLEKLKQI